MGKISQIILHSHSHIDSKLQLHLFENGLVNYKSANIPAILQQTYVSFNEHVPHFVLFLLVGAVWYPGFYITLISIGSGGSFGLLSETRLTDIVANL